MPIVSTNINLGFSAKPKFADRKFFADVTTFFNVNLIILNYLISFLSVIYEIKFELVRIVD